MLTQPKGRIDCVLDTDTYNEIDDQFALSYILRAPEKLNLRAIYAAPFANERAATPSEGMLKSYEEIHHILRLADAESILPNAYLGSERYLPDEATPVDSPAVRHLAALAMAYSPERPLYVVAIGAITNVASALLIAPEIKERIVILWLGGHAHHLDINEEFNLRQDVAAARVIFGCGAPVVQFPCAGVVDALRTTRPELEYWLSGRNKLADYLAKNTIEAAESYAAGKPWSRVIWDVAPVAWLLDEKERLFNSRLLPSPIPQYDHHYSFAFHRPLMRYVYGVNRDGVFADLFARLTR